MKVIWLPFAKKQLFNTAQYIKKTFGPKSKDKFIKAILDANRLIGLEPNIGKVEPTLNDRAIMYRCYVVAHHNKIIYCENEDHISVVDFWDCRRDPNALVSQVK